MPRKLSYLDRKEKKKARLDKVFEKPKKKDQPKKEQPKPKKDQPKPKKKGK